MIHMPLLTRIVEMSFLLASEKLVCIYYHPSSWQKPKEGNKKSNESQWLKPSHSRQKGRF
jgi:hypothetical protein